MAKLEKTKPNFFKRMFMDDNDINEKSIVGFGAFLVMVIAFGVDIYTGVKGMPFEINEFIFDGFMEDAGRLAVAKAEFEGIVATGTVNLDFSEDFDHGFVSWQVVPTVNRPHS